jgi:pimeloyl-ACP methyl ester carboxylesterase
VANTSIEGQRVSRSAADVGDPMRPDTPLDPPALTVRLGDTTVSYSVTGRGRPVVAVHGLPASRRDFRWLDAAFAGRVRLVRPDLPGFGASPAGEHEYLASADVSRAVVELCDALDLHDVVVLGHSFGGGIAVDVAAATARVSGLALVSSCGPMHHRGNFRRAYWAMLAIGDVHPTLRRLMLVVSKPVARAVGFSKHISDDAMVRAARMASVYDPARFGAQLAQLGKPVFVTYAEDDPAVETRVSEAVVGCVGEPTVLRFEEGGHNLQSSRATELADALVEWMAAG